MWDVFISYHGGNTVGEGSSYPMAVKLKEYFEHHEGKKLKCFLCKEEKCDDFYDAINTALINAKHFILVACDKTKLSKWIADELKQFDGMRKLGKKPGAIINAYVFGNVTVDDLISFNSLYATKDIAMGEGGFEMLYRMIADKGDDASRPISFEYPNRTLERLVCLRPLNVRFEQKLDRYVLGKESLNRKIRDDVVAYEATAAYEILKSDVSLLGSFVFLFTHNPQCVAEYLKNKDLGEDASVLLIDHNSDLAVLLMGKEILTVPSVANFQIVFRNKTVRMNEGTDLYEKNVSVSVGERAVELPVDSYNEYGKIPYDVLEDLDGDWCEEESSVENTDFSLFLLHALHSFEEPYSAGSEELLDEIDFCMAEALEDEYDATATEKKLWEQKRAALLLSETMLWQYYTGIKNGEGSCEEVTKKLFASRYGEIAYQIKEYYNKHNTEMLVGAIKRIHEYALEEKNEGVYAKYEYLMRILGEIYLHNIFILDAEEAVKMRIFEEIEGMVGSEYITSVRLKLRSLLCSYHKEMFFCGNFDAMGGEENAAERMLAEFEGVIGDILALTPSVEENPLKSELLLLYRERCVVWEHCGDMSLDQSERMEHYTRWKNDCELALSVGRLYPCDHELLGCVYLNLASSVNRLSVLNDGDRFDALKECLKHLDTALALFKTSAADRYIAYAYLHKSDCYESMLDEQRRLGQTDWQKNMPTIREIRRNATHAFTLFKNTADDIAKCWSLRLSVKGKVLSSVLEDRPESFSTGLKSLREAFKYSLSTKYVNGMAACVKDFTFYTELIEEKNLSDVLSEEITKTFFEEMSVFSSVIRLLKIDRKDMMDVQRQTGKIVAKLVD